MYLMIYIFPFDSTLLLLAVVKTPLAICQKIFWVDFEKQKGTPYITEFMSLSSIDCGK